MMAHFDLLEADLLRYYSYDLPLGLWGDQQPLTARRLSALVQGLPQDSATGIAVTSERAAPDRPAGPRQRSSDDQIRRLGGKVTYVSRIGG